MQLLPSAVRRFGAALPVCMAAAVLGGCSDDPNENRPVPAEIRLLSPAAQSGTPGWPLNDSVIIEVLDGQGNAISGAPVTWTPGNGGGSTGRESDTTNVAGRAAAQWVLGLNEGDQTLSVAAGPLDPVTVTATASIFHAASVTLGGQFACALDQAGQAYCWGSNNWGQLGNGSVGDPVLTPTPVSGGLVFSDLTASQTHACGLAEGGAAYCWGSNDVGESGTGTTGGSVPVPTAVQTALRFTQISAEGLTQFSVSTCGLTASGEAWCWGDNRFGQLGDGSTTSSPLPVRVQSDVPFSSIQTGFFHSCGLATTGELWCWGEQESDNGAFGARATALYPTPVLLHEEFRFTRLTTGRNYTCGLIEGGTAYCWGANWFGTLGNGQASGESPVPLAVAGGHKFVTISSEGFEENHGLTEDGALYRWGSPGNDIVQSTPLLFAQTGFVQMDSGDEPFGGGYGVCGITPDGAVYCVEDGGTIRGVPSPVTP